MAEWVSDTDTDRHECPVSMYVDFLSACTDVDIPAAVMFSANDVDGDNTVVVMRVREARKFLTDALAELDAFAGGE